MKLRLATAALTAAILGAALGSAHAADDSATDRGAGKTWVTDYSGKPPFKRRAVSATEFARFEETRTATLPGVGERLHIVDTRGHPPFRRRIVEIDATNAADFARFEEVQRPAERRRFGPPGKGFGRR